MYLTAHCSQIDLILGSIKEYSKQKLCENTRAMQRLNDLLGQKHTIRL